jgi:hypothetical protein
MQILVAVVLKPGPAIGDDEGSRDPGADSNRRVLASQCASAAGFRNLQPVVREKTAGLGPVRP